MAFKPVKRAALVAVLLTAGAAQVLAAGSRRSICRTALAVITPR